MNLNWKSLLVLTELVYFYDLYNDLWMDVGEFRGTVVFGSTVQYYTLHQQGGSVGGMSSFNFGGRIEPCSNIITCARLGMGCCVVTGTPKVRTRAQGARGCH
jgi:hypothetical protein